eukprot:360626-Chlamydomonas_euryale.AAC.5
MNHESRIEAKQSTVLFEACHCAITALDLAQTAEPDRAAVIKPALQQPSRRGVATRAAHALPAVATRQGT